jgi:hypothetical protein
MKLFILRGLKKNNYRGIHVSKILRIPLKLVEMYESMKYCREHPSRQYCNFTKQSNLQVDVKYERDEKRVDIKYSSTSSK